MSYQLELDEPILTGVQRIAREQVDQAIAEIKDPSLGPHETVHQVRKRAKKIRALIRLVRPQFEETYQAENAFYRDAARELAAVRDAQSVIEAFDRLLDVYQEPLDRTAFAPVRRFLLDRRQQAAEAGPGLLASLERFKGQLLAGRERIAGWSFEAHKFEALSGGLRKTYQRGRKALAAAYQDPGSVQFHEWRKRVKYHWYHARLLENSWGGLLDAYADQVHDLADTLGDLHDLALLDDALSGYGSPGEPGETLRALVEQERDRLRAEAKPLGERIYCEKSKRLVKRFGCYWNSWQT